MECGTTGEKGYLTDMTAIKNLFDALEKGEMSARKNGWISYEEVRKTLKV